jgi:hypothetical protein
LRERERWKTTKRERWYTVEQASGAERVCKQGKTAGLYEVITLLFCYKARFGECLRLVSDKAPICFFRMSRKAPHKLIGRYDVYMEAETPSHPVALGLA